MKRKIIKKTMAVVLTVAMCAQSMSVYASDAITDSGEEILRKRQKIGRLKNKEEILNWKRI